MSRTAVTVRPGEVTLRGFGYPPIKLSSTEEIRHFAEGIRRALADIGSMRYLWPDYTREELEEVLAKVVAMAVEVYE